MPIVLKQDPLMLQELPFTGQQTASCRLFGFLCWGDDGDATLGRCCSGVSDGGDNGCWSGCSVWVKVVVG